MQYKPEIAYSDKETVFTAYIRTLSIEIRRCIGSYLDLRPYTVVCRAGVSFWRKVDVPHQYISVEELKFYVSCEIGVDMDFFELRRWKYTLFNHFNLVDYRIEHGTHIWIIPIRREWIPNPFREWTVDAIPFPTAEEVESNIESLTNEKITARQKRIRLSYERNWKEQNRKWSQIIACMKTSSNPRETWIKMDNEIDIDSMYDSDDNIDEDAVSTHSCDRVLDKSYDYLRDNIRMLAETSFSNLDGCIKILPPFDDDRPTKVTKWRKDYRRLKM